MGSAAGSGGGSMGEAEKAKAEAVLSDWHLLYFFAQCGMFDEVRAVGSGCSRGVHVMLILFYLLFT
jgi:hypothetical protein